MIAEIGINDNYKIEVEIKLLEIEIIQHNTHSPAIATGFFAKRTPTVYGDKSQFCTATTTFKGK